jgi:hypothetical protein
MKFIERLNAKFTESVKNQCEKNANKRLAKEAKSKLKIDIAKVELALDEACNAMEDLKDSKDFNAQALWRKQMDIMKLEKELEFYKNLSKELF